MRLTQRAFSLLEVVIAIAIFSTGIVVVLGLMGTMAGRSTDATDSVTALNLPSLIESTLREESGNQFDIIQTFVSSDTALVATRLGDQIYEASTGFKAEDDAFFLIELTELKSDSFTELNSVVQPIAVTVSWPYKPFGVTTITPVEARSSVSFNLAISR